ISRVNCMSKENAQGREGAGEFAVRQALAQERARRASGLDDGVDKQRAADFLARALSRSHKYQRECEKSQRKLSALHDALQADHGAAAPQIVERAMLEHASEVFVRPATVELN
ncbi:MAG: hypothetical protein SGPRY_010748, partial [Prymnesium sp.]